MIRASCHSAASGMFAQQLNIDNIANNLANVNTAGFKKSRAEFQDLFVPEPAHWRHDQQSGQCGTHGVAGGQRRAARRL